MLYPSVAFIAASLVAFSLMAFVLCWFRRLKLKRVKPPENIFARKPCGKTLVISMKEVHNVSDLYRMVQIRTGIEDFRLHFKGKDMLCKVPVEEYGVCENSTLFILPRVRGGPLQLSDFTFRSFRKPELRTVLNAKHLRDIPGMTGTGTYSRIYTKLVDGSFSMKSWFDSLSTKVRSNLQRKGIEIYWGSESVVDGAYYCVQQTNIATLSTEEMTSDIETTPEAMEISQPSHVCSERDLRALEIEGYELLDLGKLTRAKQLEIVPLHSQWPQHSKLWSRIKEDSEFSLMQIISEYDQNRSEKFFKRLESKRLILRFGDEVLGHPDNIAALFHICKKRGRDSIDGDMNNDSDITSNHICAESRKPTEIKCRLKSQIWSCRGYVLKKT